MDSHLPPPAARPIAASMIGALGAALGQDTRPLVDAFGVRTAAVRQIQAGIALADDCLRPEAERWFDPAVTPAALERLIDTNAEDDRGLRLAGCRAAGELQAAIDAWRWFNAIRDEDGLPSPAARRYAVGMIVCHARMHGEPLDGLREVVDALGGSIVDTRHAAAARAMVDVGLPGETRAQLMRGALVADEMSAVTEAAAWVHGFALAGKAAAVIGAARGRLH